MSEYPGKFGEVCKHESLMRSCEICDLESQLTEANAKLAKLEEMAKAVKDFIELNKKRKGAVSRYPIEMALAALCEGEEKS